MDYRKEAKRLIKEFEDLPRDEWVDATEVYFREVSEESINEFIKGRKEKLACDDKLIDYIFGG